MPWDGDICLMDVDFKGLTRKQCGEAGCSMVYTDSDTEVPVMYTEGNDGPQIARVSSARPRATSRMKRRANL